MCTVIGRLVAITACLLLSGVLVCRSPAWAVPMIPAGNVSEAFDAKALGRLLDDLAGQQAEVVAIQRELVSRPALNPEHGGDGEEVKARWIETYLQANDLPFAERMDSVDDRVSSKVRPNLVIRYPGSGPRTLWIVGHMDTSPVGQPELWIGSPWVLRQDGDWLYGRGVEDNHRSLVTGLLLLKRLAANKIVPPTGLGLVFVCEEKIGFPRERGLKFLLEKRPDLFKPGDLVLLPDYGEEGGELISVAEKGVAWLKVTVYGQQSFAARPELGVNALEAGASLIAALPDINKLFGQRNTLFTPPLTTVTATKVEKGTEEVNQIPGLFTFYLDVRLLPGAHLEEVEQALLTLAEQRLAQYGASMKLERIMHIPAMDETPVDAPVVRALSQAVREQLGVTPRVEGMSGITLAAELRAHKIPVAVWAMSPCRGVDANESISIQELLQTASVFARMLYWQDAREAR